MESAMDSKQRKRAIASAIALGAMAVGIYLFVIVKVFVSR